MAINNPYAQYKQTSVETKSAGELTLMLYDGCLKFIKRAEKAIVEKDVEERNTNLVKAQNIIRELMVTLNTDVAVSQNMMQMYDFIMSRLVDANTGNDTKALKHAEQFVVEFRDTWKEVIKLDRQSRHGAGNKPNSTGNALGAIEKKTIERETKKGFTTASTFGEQGSVGATAPTPSVPNNPYAAAKRAAATAGAAGAGYRK